MMNKLHLALEGCFAIAVILLLAACGGGGNDGNNSSSITLPATAGLLNSISISPATATVAACVPTQFSATGYYSDGTSKDVTTLVFWQLDTASSGVAIANSSSGVITGIAAGNATVTAWTGKGISASALLSVTGGTLNSLAVTPATATIATGATQTYSAIATCSNGTLDISAYNIWSSGNKNVATVGVSGVATAVAVGSSVITATAGTVAASSVLNVQ